MWIEEQWNMVHLSDESKFNLFGSDGKRFLRHEIRKIWREERNGVGNDFLSGSRIHCSFSR